MAISFTNGTYFFPLLYAISSSSCYLRHVQSSLATTSWIDRNGAVVDDDPTAWFRRQWDPGIFCGCGDSQHACQHSAIDANIAIRDPKHNKSGSFLFLLLPIPLSYSQLHSVLRWFDLGDDFVLTMMTVTVTIQSLALPLRPTRPTPWLSYQGDGDGVHNDCDPFLPWITISSVSRGSVSVFHYRHPVLSRPTVPNIR